MSKRVINVFMVLAPSVLWAQTVSKEGRFSVDFTRGCAPLEIHVTELDSFGDITREYFYAPGAPETTSTTYTYYAPGVFHIVQVVGANVSPKTDTLTIHVLAPTEPVFNVERCHLNSLAITSEETTYDSIRVYFTPSDSVTLSHGDRTSFTYPNASTPHFQIRGIHRNAKENCTLFDYPISPLRTLTTPTITTSNIKETCQDFFVLTLTIEGTDPFINYQIELTQQLSTPVFEGKIRDDDVIISNVPYAKNASQYCVKVNVIDGCSSEVMEGDSFCPSITELSSTPFASLYSTYTDEGVFIHMDSVNTGHFQIYRRREGSDEFVLRREATGAFTDPIGALSRRYFYRVDYVDSCNDVLSSFETNPPLISSTKQRDNTYTVHVEEPANVLTEPLLNYEVGHQRHTTSPITTPTFILTLNPKNGTRQFLQATAEYPEGIMLRSNQITYRYVLVIHVPKAFTPNNDELNDTLELFGLPTEAVVTNIYTRWGQLIYTSTQPTPGWNGFINGRLAPEDTYVYEIIFEDPDGREVRQKGTFALIRGKK